MANEMLVQAIKNLQYLRDEMRTGCRTTEIACWSDKLDTIAADLSEAAAEIHSKQLSTLFEAAGLPNPGDVRCHGCGKTVPATDVAIHTVTDWYATSGRPFCTVCRERQSK